MSFTKLHTDALSLVLQLLDIPDVISLSCVSKSAQSAVKGSWKQSWKPQLRAVVTASKAGHLLLLNPLTGAVLSTQAVGGLQSGWATSVAVSRSGDRCWVCHYAGHTVKEHRLPCLSFEGSGQQVHIPGLGQPLRNPEGIVQAHGRLYVAWAEGYITSHQLGGPAAGSPGTHPGPLAQLEHCQRLPGLWVPWGMRLGPDNALYAAVNQAYELPSPDQGGYGREPPERLRGTVACLQLDGEGRIVGRPRSFTARGHLSRPSGLCFDGAGDLYVTHLGGQVLKFAGPAAAQPGQLLGVFIDARLPRHGLAATPPAGPLPPTPFDICWRAGLFFLTTHTCMDVEEGEEEGKLSVWDGRGALLRVHDLGAHGHPNMLEVYCQPS